MTMLDSLTDTIPEGKYIDMCNILKNLYDEKPEKTIDWKTYTLEEGRQITINFKNGKEEYDLTIGTIRYKSHRIINGVFQKQEMEVTFSNSMYDDLTIKMDDLKDFLVRHFKLVDSSKIEYNYIRQDAEKKIHLAHRLFEFESHIKNIIDMHFMDRNIEKYLKTKEQTDDEDDDNDELDDITEEENWKMRILCDAESIFYNNVAYIIRKDIEEYIRELSYTPVTR